jgi:hypothetical protein
VLIRPPQRGSFIGYVEEAVILPARAHSLVHVKVIRDGLELTKEHVVMMTAAFSSGGAIQVPAPLAKVGNKVWQNVVAVTNFANEKLELRAGTIVIVAEPVEQPAATNGQVIYWPSYPEEEQALEAWEESLYVRSLKVKIAEEEPNREIPSHLVKLYEESVKNIPDAKDRQLIRDLLLDHQEVFSKPGQPLEGTVAAEHAIDTGNHPPIRQKLRRMGAVREQATLKELSKLLEHGVVVPSNSPWRSPVVLVKKKNGEIRFCIDFRALNDCTVKDSYPLPRIDTTLEALAGSAWFCTMDLTSGFWQIPLKEADQHKTAFATASGLFEFTVMPFGLCNASATFERCMENVLRGLCWTDCLVYIDDIITAGKDIRQTAHRTALVYERLIQARLKLRPDKCHLFQTSINFLGHTIDKEGIRPDESKTAALFDRPDPQNKEDLKSFLGSTGYYRTHIADYADLAEPLTILMRSETPWTWGEEQRSAYEILRAALASRPILGYPTTSHEGWIVDCDASDYAIGAVLSQVQDGVEVVIANASKTMSAVQRRYCVTKKELLALEWALERFKPYVYGRKFLIRTDHKSLLAWKKLGDKGGMEIERWIGRIAESDFEIQHRSG